MEKSWIRSESVQTARGERAELSYYLLTRPGGLCDQYGVEITLRTEDREESAVAVDLTPIGSEILRLIASLADGTVTPTGLADVIQDWLP